MVGHYALFRQKLLSPLTSAEVICRLRTATVLPNNGSWRDTFAPDPVRPFVGVVGDKSFAIRRIIAERVRKAEPPMIQGSVTDNSKGSLVTLRFCLHPFTVFLICLVTVAAAVALVAWAVGSSAFYLCFSLWPAYFIGTEYVRFRIESARLRPFFLTILVVEN